MRDQILQERDSEAWALSRRQHSVVARVQLLALGFSAKAIKHRVAVGRLHPKWRGVYAVGRPELSRRGEWMAAVLSCGPQAALGHRSAAALWGLTTDRAPIEVTVPDGTFRDRPGIQIHRGAREVTRRSAIPVTSPACTLVDLAATLAADDLEAAINEADKLDLIDPERLRRKLDDLPGQHGVKTLRQMLDRRTFTLTDSALERRFLPLVEAAGLPQPLTQAHLNGHRVDFWWPDLELVVETDGLRYHRTPAEQTRDRVRDQVHTAAGLTPLRFTRAQIAFDPAHVQAVLTAVARKGSQRRSRCE